MYGMKGTLILAAICLVGVFGAPLFAQSSPPQRGDVSVAYGAEGFSGSVEYYQDIKDRGAVWLCLGKQGEDWAWRVRAATSGEKVACTFGVGNLGNSYSIRPRPYGTLLLRRGPDSTSQETMLTTTCHPTDLIVDTRIEGLRLVAAAALAATPAANFFSDPGVVLRASAEMSGIEYGVEVPDCAGALSFCVSHLPPKENSGGWQPETPTVVEDSLTSLSAAIAFRVAGVETNIWAGMSAGYFDRPGFAARVETGFAGPTFPGAVSPETDLCLFLASPTYRLVKGGWPSSDGLFKVTVGIGDGRKSVSLASALYSARGWPYAPLAADPGISGAGLFFAYMKPSLFKSRLDVSCDSIDCAGAVEVDEAGIARLGLSIDFEKKPTPKSSILGPTKWHFTKLRFGPRCNFKRSSLSGEEDGEETENDDTGEEDDGAGGSGADAGSGATAVRTLVPEKIGCSCELHWAAESKEGRQGSGRLAFEAMYRQKSAERCYWAFVLSISQAVPVTENLEAFLLLKSPSGGWQTRAGREVVPTISLGATMKRGGQK